MATIEGWYYLHVNKDLIYKNNPDAIQDIRESDLCHTAWGWDNSRQTAWSILVEATVLGAKGERIEELAKHWNCDDEDAENYAKYLGIVLKMDGTAHCAHRSDFTNLQESPCGFGSSYLEAMANLADQLGYVGGKMWNSTFESLVKNQ